jgi:hypothetical protein
MKLNLLVSSLLLGAVMALTVDEVKKMKNSAAVKKAFDNSAADKAVVIAAFPELKEKQTSKLTSDNILEIVNAAPAAIAKVHNVPVKYFKDRAFVDALYAEICHLGADRPEFFSMLSLEQFSAYVAKSTKGAFNAAFTIDFMNALLPAFNNNKSKVAKYAAACSIEFLDHLFQAPAPLGAEVIKGLPENFLSKIQHAPDAADGEFWTPKQLAAIKKGYQAALDFTHVPKKNMKYFKGAKLLRRVVNQASSEQASKFTVEQWNEIFEKKEGCKLIPSGTKLSDVSSIKMAAKCFTQLPSDVQSHIIVNHKNLPADALERITQAQAEAWEHKDASGLEILKYTENKEMIKNLGAHEDVDVDSHPCAGMDIDSVKKIKALHANLSGKIIEAMNLENPESIKELEKHAEFYAGMEDIFSAIDDLKVKKNKSEKKDKKDEEPKAKKPTVWSEMKEELAAKLFAPVYSKLPAEITKEAFDQLSAAIKVAMPAHAVANLAILKKLNKEEYAMFGEKAFAAISSEQAADFRLADVTEAQFPHVSVEAKESLFAKVPAAELAKESARFNLLSAPQVAAFPAKTFQAVITKDTMAKLTPEATKKITSEQLKTVNTEVLAAITPEQVAVLGADVEDEKLSGLAVLLANQDSLNASARAALHVRVPGSSAVRATVSAGVIAAVAALALLA